MGRDLRTCALAALACLAPAGAEGHGWHSGLKDRYGVSCCGGEDCRPTAMCRLPDGREGIVVLDACRPIPWDKVLDVASPDGGTHVCAVPSRNGGGVLVVCVVLGGSFCPGSPPPILPAKVLRLSLVAPPGDCGRALPSDP